MNLRHPAAFFLIVSGTLAGLPACESSDWPDAVERTLDAAGDNRGELEAAMQQVPPQQAQGLQFLIVNMPERDAQTLSAEFLLRNVDLAYQAKAAAPWGDQIPEHVFLNGILPYASINESRDDWRQKFRERFLPIVRNARTPSEAAARLNQTIFPQLNVKYSTKRRRADQGPFESIQSGLASCTGLSILLIDACRAVGIPARFVGTPLWSDGSGNHSWVEIWDEGWHFTGAAEPTGDVLDKAWFTGRASGAVADDPRHAIYAVSFQETPLTFPLVWDRKVNYVHAVNVTHRYVTAAQPMPEGHARVMFVTHTGPESDRVAADIVVTDNDGTVVFEGRTRDERFDRNDHLTAILPLKKSYEAEFTRDTSTTRQSFQLIENGQVIRGDLK